MSKKIDGMNSQPMSIDVNLLLNLKCKKCLSKYFQTVVLLKIIPRIVDPNLVDDVIKPLLGYRCINCGEILLVE